MSLGDSHAVRSVLDEAIVAFIGHGRRRTPAEDNEAVLAIDPANGAALLRTVKDIVRISDTVAFDDVAPFDSELRERLYARFRARLPEVGRTGIEALGWRWGFLNFS